MPVIQCVRCKLSRDQQAFPPFPNELGAAGIYWALTAVFTFFQSRLERRISKGYVRGGPTPDRKTKIVSVSGQGSSGGDVPIVVEEDIGPELGGQGH